MTSQSVKPATSLPLSGKPSGAGLTRRMKNKSGPKMSPINLVLLIFVEGEKRLFCI
ncbi:MAG: hypothetical protein ACRD6U_01095 [Nitrososphaeraceae archaeon]